MEYLVYFLVTLSLSTVFATAGLGSAVALVPTLNFFGLTFSIARASGLFVNFITTVTISILNIKHKNFELFFALPLILSSMIFAYIGSKISLEVDTQIVKTVFGYTLIVIATAILFLKKAQTTKDGYSIYLLLFAGSIGGFFSGFLGIGGGSIISPILLLFGYDAKKVALGISFVIPFSSIVAFSNYALNVELDYLLLFTIAIAAYIGGMVGNYLLHFKVSSSFIKKILAFSLYIIAFKMVIF